MSKGNYALKVENTRGIVGKEKNPSHDPSENVFKEKMRISQREKMSVAGA